MCSVIKQLAIACQARHSLSTVSHGLLAWVLKPLDDCSTKNLITEHTPDSLRGDEDQHLYHHFAQPYHEFVPQGADFDMT